MYRVYVIELSKKVFSEDAKFRKANPQYDGVRECLYVGMTSKAPKERFEQHRRGQRGKRNQRLHSSVVRRYGMYLRPSLYEHLAPVRSRSAGLALEEELALELRRKRYAVWYN